MVQKRKVKSSSVNPIIIAIILLAILFGVWLFLSLQQDEANEVIINPDVVVYEEGASGYSILSSDSDTVTVSSSEGLEVGNILSAGITDETPYGLLRRIVAIEGDDGHVVLETEQAALTEAIEKCDVSVTVMLEDDGMYHVSQDGTQGVFPLAVQPAFAAGKPDNLFVYPPREDSDREKEKSDREDDDAYTVDGLRASAGIMIEGKLLIENGEIGLRLVDHLYAGFELGVVSLEKDLFATPLAPFVIPVGPIEVVFSNDLLIKIAAEATVEAIDYNVNASLDKSIGFEYTTHDGIKGINEDASTLPSLHFSMEPAIARLNFDAALSATLSSKLYGVAGVELTAALDNETELHLQSIPEGEESEGAIELPGIDTKLRGSLLEKITVPISGEFVVGMPDEESDTKDEGDSKKDNNPKKGKSKKVRNPFDGGKDLVDIELFDTGDTITLLEINESFGEIVNLGAEIVGTWFHDFDPEGMGGADRPIFYLLEVSGDGTAILNYRMWDIGGYAWDIVGNEYVFTRTYGHRDPVFNVRMNDDGTLDWDGLIFEKTSDEPALHVSDLSDYEEPKTNPNGETIRGTVSVTSYRERAAEVVPGLRDFANNDQQLVLLLLDNPTTLTAYVPGDGPKTKTIDSASLPIEYALYDGQKLSFTATSWGSWPSDTSGALFGINLNGAKNLRVIGR